MNTVQKHTAIQFNAMIFRGTLLLCLGLCTKWATAQSTKILDTYIETAFNQNLLLKEKKGNLEKSMWALKEAKTLFLPTVWQETQYTLAQGGRTIEVPVGDLMNPVYATLNQLTNSNKFPQINNSSEQFLPNNFYDVRIKSVVPILNPELKSNQNIKTHQTALQEQELKTYQRELVLTVKQAYYQYAQAYQSQSIYQNAIALVEENLRFQQALLKNGKGLYAYVSRAESEREKVRAQLEQSKNNTINAKAYFNFLLNRTLTDSIIVEETTPTIVAPTLDSNYLNREELKSLTIGEQIQREMLQLNKSAHLPKLNAFLDMGAQGFDFEMKKQSFFYLAGIQLQIPLFNANRNQYKIEQSKIDVQNILNKSAYTKEQMNMAALVSRNQVLNAIQQYQATTKQVLASKQYFKLIDRGFKEGVNNFIEWLDARTQQTNAALQQNILFYQYLIALADYERQTASYPLQ